MNKMKFDGLFLGRIHYQDKVHREKNKLMEVVWRTSESLGKLFLIPKDFTINFECI